MTIVRLLRSPEGEGAPALPPTLAELDATSSGDSGGIQGGDGSPKIPSISGPAPATPSTPAPGTEGNKEGQEGQDQQKGEEPDAGENKEEGKTDDKGDQTAEEQTEEQFFEVVEKITGRHVEVKYPDDIDPVSPEGVALRDEAIRENAFDEFEKDLATRNPRGYAFLLHIEAGGSEEEFFNKTPGYTLPELDKVKESVEIQTNLYRHDLRSRGLDEDTIEALVQKAIKDNKLLERANTAYQTIDTAQRQQLAELAKEKERQQQLISTAVTGIRDRLTKAINDEVSLVVPEAQKQEFTQFVMDNLQFDPQTRKFWIVQELDESKLKTQVESLFYQHIKGDLKSVIQKKAETIASQRLRLKAESSKTGSSSGSTGTSTGKKHLTLGEI